MKKLTILFVGLVFLFPAFSHAQTAKVLVETDCDVAYLNKDCIELKQKILELQILILRLQLQLALQQGAMIPFDLPQPDTAGMSEEDPTNYTEATTTPTQRQFKPNCVTKASNYAQRAACLQ